MCKIYTQFLLITRHDHVAAEKLLVRGLKVDPDDTDTLSLYGMLLWEYRCGEGLQGGSDEKMYTRIEELLTKAYKTDPKIISIAATILIMVTTKPIKKRTRNYINITSSFCRIWTPE